jgi:branched-chain amino acid transport system substrate-binding protein
MTWANFQGEYFVVASYLVKTFDMGTPDGGKVAFVRFDTEHGEDALIGTKAALKTVDADVVLDVPTPTNQTDYDSVALRVKRSGAEWLGIQLSSENGGNLLQSMARIGYRPKVFTQADYSDPSFAKNFPDVAEGLYGALQVRTSEKPLNPQLKEHIAYFKSKTGKELTTWRAVGYLQGLVTVKALQGMKAPTRECLVESLKQIRNFNTGIQAPITFGADRRMGVDALSVFQIRNGTVVQILPFESEPLILKPLSE